MVSSHTPPKMFPEDNLVRELRAEGETNWFKQSVIQAKKKKKSFRLNNPRHCPFLLPCFGDSQWKMFLPLHNEQIHSPISTPRQRLPFTLPASPSLCITNPHSVISSLTLTPGNSIQACSLYSHKKDERWVWFNFRQIQAKTWKSSKDRKQG